MRKLVRGDEAHLVVAEPPVEQRVPEDHPLARPDPGGIGVRGRCGVTHLLLAHGRVAGVLSLFEQPDLPREFPVLERMALDAEQVRRDELQRGEERDEERRRRAPPPAAELLGEAEEEGEDEEGDEGPSEQSSPGRRKGGTVRLRGNPVPALPPVAREPEGKRDRPRDGQRHDPRDDAGIDPAQPERAGEARTATRHPDQRAETGQCAQEPVDVQQPLIGLRAADEACSEDRALVERGQVQVGRDLRPPKDRGGRDPDDAAALWTSGVLTHASRRFLESLKPSEEADGVDLFHASARDPIWEYVLTEEAARATLELSDAPLVLVGHSHVALAITLDGGEVLGGLAPGGSAVELDGRWLLNPGSVGQPRDGDPRAAWMLLDLEQKSAAFRRVEYSVEQTQTEMRERGLPGPLAARLARGE